MTQAITVDGERLTFAALARVVREGASPVLDEGARERMARSRAWVASAVRGEVVDDALRPLPIYGVSTGFGSLARVHLPSDLASALSRNLLRSHAAGVGPPAPPDVARAMVLLRANALAKGYSGCRPELVEHLLALLRAGVSPVVPSQGSCGSSGDLAPLSHLGLLVAHRPDDLEADTGEAWVGGRRVSGREALRVTGLAPLPPEAKEGLAITNGAQLTTAYAALAVVDAAALLERAEVAAALSIEALRGVTRAFHPLVHALRPYAGAASCARNLLKLLRGSGWVDTVPGKVQDAYALRCTPVVLGAARDGFAHVRDQVAVELNAVTDNPVICLEIDGPDKAVSAGLFHGEPVGLAADYLKVLVAEVASLAERRLYRLVTGPLSASLPPSLGQEEPGVGLLSLQTTAAALVSENKALGWPASLDSIPTCEDQEDHVAMSTTAARRAWEVVINAGRVVDIELLCAARALAWRRAQEPGVRMSPATQRAFEPLIPLLPRAGTTPGEAVVAVGEVVRAPEWYESVSAAAGGLERVTL